MPPSDWGSGAGTGCWLPFGAGAFAGNRGDPIYGVGGGSVFSGLSRNGSTSDGSAGETPVDPRRTIVGVTMTTSSVSFF